jgi:hypothetical protein
MGVNVELIDAWAWANPVSGLGGSQGNIEARGRFVQRLLRRKLSSLQLSRQLSRLPTLPQGDPITHAQDHMHLLRRRVQGSNTPSQAWATAFSSPLFPLPSAMAGFAADARIMSRQTQMRRAKASFLSRQHMSHSSCTTAEIKCATLIIDTPIRDRELRVSVSRAPWRPDRTELF